MKNSFFTFLSHLHRVLEYSWNYLQQGPNYYNYKLQVKILPMTTIEQVQTINLISVYRRVRDYLPCWIRHYFIQMNQTWEASEFFFCLLHTFPCLSHILWLGLLFSIFCLLNSQASGTVSKRLQVFSFHQLQLMNWIQNGRWKIRTC